MCRLSYDLIYFYYQFFNFLPVINFDDDQIWVYRLDLIIIIFDYYYDLDYLYYYYNSISLYDSLYLYNYMIYSYYYYGYCNYCSYYLNYRQMKN